MNMISILSLQTMNHTRELLVKFVNKVPSSIVIETLLQIIILY